jgi:uncharacterized protein YabE (DUF348 family)
VYYAVRERDLNGPGGSTITQQLVKLTFLSSEKSISRKVKEAILAAEITRRYDKDTILRIYLNEIYYGNLAYGIEAAAETYFGKHAKDLTLAQASMLAGLPQAPAYYDPYTKLWEADGQPGPVKRRQGVVLRLMVESGFISNSQADAAWAEPLVLQPLKQVYDSRHPHFVLYARSQVEQLVGPEALLWDSETTPARSVSHRGGLRTSADAGTSVLPVVTLRRAVPLVLDDNGTATTLRTTLETVGQVLQEQGIVLFLGDEVKPGFHERITAGMTVAIHRSVPVQIQVDGRTIHTRTRAETVAGALGQESIALLGKDRAEPDLSAPIRSGLIICVTRIREEVLVEFEPIPFQTEWVPDPQVEIDNIRLAQAGQVGLTKRRFRVLYADGREVARTLEDVWTEQPPTTKTMAYGTKIIIRTLQTPDGPIEYWRKMRVYTTSYTAATCGKPRSHPRYGYTRLGLWLTKGIVAVDPTVIPLKTRMYVPGYGFAYAGDTGGGVKGKFVDLGFDEGKYQSWHWWTDIYLLTPVPSPDKIRWILPDLPKFPDRRR